MQRPRFFTGVPLHLLYSSVEWPLTAANPLQDLTEYAANVYEEYAAQAKGDCDYLVNLEGYLSRLVDRSESSIDLIADADLKASVSIVHGVAHVRLLVLRRVLATKLVLGAVPSVEDFRRLLTLRDNELAVAHGKIRRLQDQRRFGSFDHKELMALMDCHRFKSSGRVNFSAVGKELGVDPDTAKNWIRKAGLLGYAGGK